MPVLTIISGLLGAIPVVGKYLDFMNTRQTELNTPQMQANAAAKTDAAIADQAAADVANAEKTGNLDAIRKDTAP